MGGQDQDFDLGEETKVRLGSGLRLALWVVTTAVFVVGAFYRESAERREADLSLRSDLSQQLKESATQIARDVDQRYVKVESSNYRYDELSKGLQSAIRELNADIGFLRRDVTTMNDFVREIPTISAQLKVLQERKQ